MEALEVETKISNALNNRKNLSQKEIDSVWAEVTAFIETLSKEERAAFYWKSCAEALFMMTTESKNLSPTEN